MLPRARCPGAAAEICPLVVPWAVAHLVVSTEWLVCQGSVCGGRRNKFSAKNSVGFAKDDSMCGCAGAWAGGQLGCQLSWPVERFSASFGLPMCDSPVFGPWRRCPSPCRQLRDSPWVVGRWTSCLALPNSENVRARGRMLSHPTVLFLTVVGISEVGSSLLPFSVVYLG